MSLTLHRRPATEAELRRIANAVARREVTYAEVERQLGYAPRTLPSRVRKALGPSYVRRQRRAFILATVADLQPCTAEQVADDLELSPDSMRRSGKRIAVPSLQAWPRPVVAIAAPPPSRARSRLRPPSRSTGRSKSEPTFSAAASTS